MTNLQYEIRIPQKIYKRVTIHYFVWYTYFRNRRYITEGCRSLLLPSIQCIWMFQTFYPPLLYIKKYSTTCNLDLALNIHVVPSLHYRRMQAVTLARPPMHLGRRTSASMWLSGVRIICIFHPIPTPLSLGR